MAQLLYGSGLRLMECCKLRVKDIDFGNNQIFVRRGKGDVDRTALLPAYLIAPLRDQLEHTRTPARSAATTSTKPPSKEPSAPPPMPARCPSA